MDAKVSPDSAEHLAMQIADEAIARAYLNAELGLHHSFGADPIGSAVRLGVDDFDVPAPDDHEHGD